MASELRIPEGIVVKTARGGVEVLKNILNDIKQYSFNGYIKVILKKNTMNSTGYLVIDQGVPAMSIYQFEKAEPRRIRRIYAGEKSLRFIWEDSQDKLSLIELHSRVPKEEFDRRFPDAKLVGAAEFEAQISKPAEKKAKPKKGFAKKVEPDLREATLTEDPIWEEIQKIRHQGYSVDELEKIFRTNRVVAKKELAKYQEKIDELKKLENLLDNLPRVGLDDEITRLKSKLNDPEQLVEIKEEIEVLKENIKSRIQKTKKAERKIEEDIKKKKREEKVADLYELILQYQSGKVPAKETLICDKCGGILDGKGVCPKCQESEQEAIELRIPEDMIFDNFVVGTNSKFAYAAALAVARAPDKAYNPLYIYGKSGMGKTHLISSIAKFIIDTSSDREVVYISSEKFAEDLEHALNSNTVSEFRDRFRKRKALLIDDFQFVAGKEMTQEELLYLLEETMRNGGQVVVASDRLPREIPRLNERLTVKVQGGLIADIQPPDKQTRIAILKKKMESRAEKMPDSVLEYIAEKVQTNVRELEAALNRLIAFSTVMKLDIDLQLTKEVLLPTIASQEDKEGLPFEVEIKPGHSYLIEEDRPIQSNRLLLKKIEEGYKGLEITRMNPGQVREKFGTAAEILWLTDKESKIEKTIPPSLEMIMHVTEEFRARHENGILLIDGLQYLISNTSFEGVLRFIRRLIDEFSESNSILMISASPGTLRPQDLSILERELETIKFS